MKKMDDIICNYCGLDFQVYWVVSTGDVDFCPGCGSQIYNVMPVQEEVDTVDKRHPIAGGIWYDEASRSYHWHRYDGKGGLVAESISLREIYMKRRPGGG